jgi:hypothetical protein
MIFKTSDNEIRRFSQVQIIAACQKREVLGRSFKKHRSLLNVNEDDF